MAKKKATKPEMKLTEAELRRYEEADLKRKIFDLEIRLTKEKQNTINQIMVSNQLQLKLLNSERAAITDKQNQFNAGHAKFNEDVLTRLGISGPTFGFNPMTGDVIVDKKE